MSTCSPQTDEIKLEDDESELSGGKVLLIRTHSVWRKVVFF